VKNLDYVHSSVTLRGEVVTIKPQQLLNRIGIAAKDEAQKQEALQYELAVQPTSLNLNGDLRKNIKSKFMDFIVKNVEASELHPATLYVVDGGFLLQSVYWPPKVTYNIIYQAYYNFIIARYNENCVVVFDASTEVSTKDQKNKFKSLENNYC
jgi:hypothetical protein